MYPCNTIYYSIEYICIALLHKILLLINYQEKKIKSVHIKPKIYV